jgi:hypothetical protein
VEIVDMMLIAVEWKVREFPLGHQQFNASLTDAELASSEPTLYSKKKNLRGVTWNGLNIEKRDLRAMSGTRVLQVVVSGLVMFQVTFKTMLDIA